MNKEELVNKLDQKVFTVGDFKKMFENVSDDTPIVVFVDGGFGFASQGSLAFAFTWDKKRVWVTENPHEESEFDTEKSLANNDLISAVYLSSTK